MNTPNITEPKQQTTTENQFHILLADFFASNDAQGHIKTLTALCRAFTGIAPVADISRLDIANMLFASDQLRGFIRRTTDLYYSPDHGGMSENEKSHIGDLIGGVSDNLIEIIGVSLQDWVYPTEPEHVIEYLNESLVQFNTISHLIRLCSKIHLTSENQLEGGVPCTK